MENRDCVSGVALDGILGVISRLNTHSIKGLTHCIPGLSFTQLRNRSSILPLSRLFGKIKTPIFGVPLEILFISLGKIRFILGTGSFVFISLNHSRRALFVSRR